MLCGLWPHTTVIAQEKIPFAPSVFLGAHQQAAIVLDYVWDADRNSDETCPSVIADIWYDGSMGLYFVAAPEPLRLYHWIMGEDSIRLVAVQDDVITDIVTLSQQKKSALGPPSDAAQQRFVIQEGVFMDTQTDRALPTPPFEVVDVVIELSDDMFAVVSFAEGISVVNITLTTSTPLRIDPWAEANNRLLRCFELANPDIPLQNVRSRNVLTGLVFGSILPLHDMLRCVPGEVDVFCASIEEAEAARRKGLLMDLSVSSSLFGTVSQYYPRVQDALLRQGFLTGIPIDINPRLWSIQYTDWMRFGKSVIPRTLDELTALLYGKSYEDGIIYMSPDVNGEVYVDWVFAQYIAQYAQESEPLNFDTPLFRELLEAARAYEEQRYMMIDEAYEINLNYDRGLRWSYGVQGFLPPTFTQQEDAQVYTEMNVWCVDGSTPNAPQALRFLEFQARHTDPIYDMLLTPSTYRTIRCQPEAAKLPIVTMLQAQAEQHDLSDTARTLYSEMDVLLNARSHIEAETLSFYAREMAPRMKFLFGGMYEDLDAITALEEGGDYSREGYGFSRVVWEYIYQETDDIDAVVTKLNQMARDQYDLWHKDGLDFSFEDWLMKYGSR